MVRDAAQVEARRCCPDFNTLGPCQSDEYAAVKEPYVRPKLNATSAPAITFTEMVEDRPGRLIKQLVCGMEAYIHMTE